MGPRQRLLRVQTEEQLGMEGGGEVLLRDGFRLVWLEEQNGSEKKDFHESGGEKKRRRNLGLK